MIADTVSTDLRPRVVTGLLLARGLLAPASSVGSVRGATFRCLADVTDLTPLMKLRKLRSVYLGREHKVDAAQIEVSDKIGVRIR